MKMWVKMSSTTIFDFYVGIVCTFESSQIAASGVQVAVKITSFCILNFLPIHMYSYVKKLTARHQDTKRSFHYTHYLYKQYS